MWPQTLQMNRDECRGILRRLELESYSNVISVFRAQGGLNEPKVKMLEELRNIFHISQERHRAEARRVANDEHLCTIAEAISGPNTWQEWAREGRRSYPCLPRALPQHALTLIADDISAKTILANENLPFPSETAAAVVEEEASYIAARGDSCKLERNIKLVTSEPFKMPDIPAEVKKNLKRNSTSAITTTNNKKRQNHDSSTHKNEQHPTTANKTMENDGDVDSGHYNHRLQQQRYFHQQHQKQKMLAKKIAAANAHTSTKTSKRQAKPAKSGRRTQKLLKQQQQQKLLLQEQQLHQQELLHSNIYSSNNELQLDLVDELKKQPHHYHQQPRHQLPNLLKKKHFGGTTQSPVTSMRILGMDQQQHQQNSISPTTIANMNTTNFKESKHLISTPVQKYIVEDRQPQMQTPQPINNQAVNVAATQILGAGNNAGVNMAQIINLPINTVLTPTTTKIRAANNKPTTSTKKKNMLTTSTAIISEQVPILLDGTAAISNPMTNVTQMIPVKSKNISASTSSSSTHIISYEQQQQQSSPPSTTFVNNATTSNLKEKQLISTPVQKYIVEDRQPLTIGPTSNVVPAAAVAVVGTPTLTNTSNVNIIKNIPASSLNNTLITPLTPTSSTVFRKAPTNIIKTISVSTTNTNATTSTATNSNSNIAPLSGNMATGPQIISNIKLTSATVATTAAPTGATPTAQQFNLKNLTSGSLRTSVKICQSPNGKVFIQPANLSEATKVKLQQCGFPQQKLHTSHTVPTSLAAATATTTTVMTSAIITSTTAATATSTSTLTPQRISIQKVQIIPAPNAANSTTTTTTTTKPTTLTFTGNKNNMIFLPASATSNMRPITFTKAHGATASSLGNIITKSTDVLKQSNVVVIGSTTTKTASAAAATAAAGMTNKANATAMIATATSQTKVPIFKSVTKPSTPIETNQLITEDTPVDILNMPIIVERTGSSSCDGRGDINTLQQTNNIGETVTLLNANDVAATQQQRQDQQQSMLILDATDWEMELDQATKIQQHTNVQKDEQQQQQHIEYKTLDSDAIIIDESFEDVIVEEEIVVSAEDDAVTVLEETVQPINAELIDETQLELKAIDSASLPINSYQFEEQPDAAHEQAATVGETVVVVSTPHVTQLKNCITNEVAIDENTAIEYIEMDLEKPHTTVEFTNENAKSKVLKTEAIIAAAQMLKAAEHNKVEQFKTKHTIITAAPSNLTQCEQQ